MAEMASGQRGFDTLLLGEEPIERVVEFLLVDLAERQHGAERRGRGGAVEQPRGGELGGRIEQPRHHQGGDEPTMRALCRWPSASRSSRPSSRRMPSAAATWPWGRLRMSLRSARGSCGAYSSRNSRRSASILPAGQYVMLASVRFLTLPSSR